MFLAGAEPVEYQKCLKAVGVPNVLQSYFYLSDRKHSLYGHAKNLLIDSGGYTARVKGVPIDADEFCEWLNKNGVRTAFELDTNDVAQTVRNREKQQLLCPGTYTIPIYHITDYLAHREMLDDFVARYPYIGVSLGGASLELRSTELRRDFLDHVFSKTRDVTAVHGLGITGRTFMERYPFFSVDSTSWLQASRYGTSRLNKGSLLTKFKSRTRHYIERSTQEVHSWLAEERRITALWSHRGVRWPTSLDTLLSRSPSSGRPRGTTRPTTPTRPSRSRAGSRSAARSST